MLFSLLLHMLIMSLRMVSILIYDVSELTIDLDGNTLTTGKLNGVFEGSNFIITNGTVDSGGASYSLWIGENPTSNVVVDGVTVRGGINIYNASDVVLKNNTVNGNTYYAVWADSDTSGIEIQSGTYNGAAGMPAVRIGSKDADKVKVIGGKFSPELDDDYVSIPDDATVAVNPDGTITVIPAVAVAPAASYSAPKTGDNTNIALQVSLVAMSAAAFVVLSKKARFN